MSNKSKTSPKETPQEKKNRISLLEDFFDIDSKNTQNKYKNNSKNDKNNIEKNQQEFGQRKRIKP